MNEKTKDLIERYLYDVVRRLPEKQREDIKRELRTLIEDMLMEKGGIENATEKDLKVVLEQLGSPAELARSYRGSGKYLIGEKYYDQYILILKIVLLCTGVGLLISFVVSTVIQSTSASDAVFYIEKSTENFFQIPAALLNVFAWITIVFAIIERTQVKLDVKPMDWKVEDLPLLPNKKNKISRVESIVGMVFAVIGLSIFVGAPEIFSIWLLKNGSYEITTIFNLTIWNAVLPFFVAGFMLGFLNDMIRLIAGRYNLAVVISTVVTEVLSLIIFIIIFKVFNIWNPDFIALFRPEIIKEIGKEIILLNYLSLDVVINIIIFFMAIGCIASSVKAIYYTIRYGK